MRCSAADLLVGRILRRGYGPTTFATRRTSISSIRGKCQILRAALAQRERDLQSGRYVSRCTSPDIVSGCGGNDQLPRFKQHLACLRMLFDWLVTGQVLPAPTRVEPYCYMFWDDRCFVQFLLLMESTSGSCDSRKARCSRRLVRDC